MIIQINFQFCLKVVIHRKLSSTLIEFILALLVLEIMIDL
jgi:hypothetical protein